MPTVGLSLLIPTLLIVGGVVLASAYNRLVRCRNFVAEGLSGIDVQLKRRHDLIPSLVECVKGYAGFERSLLEELTKLREDADHATTMADVNERETRLNGGLVSLFARVEAYPDLKANATFEELTQQLVATEDALQYARRYYNGAVRDLNIAVEAFPSNLVATWFGFRTAEYFQVESVGERAAPQVTHTSPAATERPVHR